MSWSFRSKLFLVSLSVIATSVVAADLYLRPALDEELTSRIQSDLLVRVALIEKEVTRRDSPFDDVASWDQLADEMGTRSQTRVTFVRPDGVVIGDSSLSLRELADVENHAERPEVREALAGRSSHSTRNSVTVHERMLYVASPVWRGGKVAGVIRVAMPLVDVERAIVRLHGVLGVGSVLGLGLALFMSSGAAFYLARALREITQTARRMARGDLDVRIHTDSDDELGELGRTLNQLAGNLSTSLADLRSEKDLLGRILESMEEGVLVVDAHERIVMVNPALRSLLLADSPTREKSEGRASMPEIAVLGRSVMEVMRNPELHAQLETTLTSHAPSTGEIEMGRRKPRRLLVHAAPLSGEPRGCVVVLVDVTETRRLESIRKDFVANVSHELRTPLTAVRTALETARGAMGRDPEAANRFLDMVDRNAERLASLVNDLLDLSRIESGEWRVNPEDLNLADLLFPITTIFQEPAARKRLALQVKLPADLPPVWADRRAVEQVLTNLLDNAVKYGGEAGEIRIEATVLRNQIRLQVIDTGPGIDARHLPRLFERFYRVDAGRSRDRGGTGLGLAIVKHLVEVMGGAVSVDSVVGRGTTFTVSLPAAG